MTGRKRYRGADAQRTPSRVCGESEIPCLQCREPISDAIGDVTCASCGLCQYRLADGGRGRHTDGRKLAGHGFDAHGSVGPLDRLWPSSPAVEVEHQEAVRLRAKGESDAALRLWSLDGRRWVRRIARGEQRARGLTQTGRD